MTELSTTTHTVLAATAPFDFASSLRAMASFAPCSGDQRIADGRVRRAFLHPSDPTQAVVTEVAARGDGEPGVTLSIFSERPLASAETSAVAERVSDWLSLADDRTEFLMLARTDPAMTRVLTVTEGLHQVRFASLSEAAAYFTLTQRSQQWHAANHKRQLATAFGPRGTVDGLTYTAFPAAATLSTASVEQIAPHVAGPARAARVLHVLTGLATIDEAWLRTAPFEEARAALLRIKGVGPFTSQALLLRALGRPDSVPLEMDQFTKLSERLYGSPCPSGAELRDWYGATIGWWAYNSRMGLGWLAADEAAAGAGQKPRRTSNRSSNRSSSQAGGPAPEQAASGQADGPGRAVRVVGAGQVAVGLFAVGQTATGRTATGRTAADQCATGGPSADLRSAVTDMAATR